MATSIAASSLFGIAREPPRLLFMAAILFGHGLIVYLLLDRTGMLRVAVASDELWSRVYIAPIPDRRPPSPLSSALDNPAGADTRQPTIKAPVFVPSPLVEKVPPTTSSDPVASDTAPPIDWAREAEDGARRSVQLGASGRLFSDSTRDETRTRREPEEVPKADPGRRAGVIEMVGPGIERRWISQKCYWEFGQPPPLFAGPGPKTNQVHCMVGSAEPNSHLFDEIRPRYLRKKD
jgi:hypothetical protein